MDKFEAQPCFFFEIASDRTNSTIAIEDSGICLTEHELCELIPNASDAMDSSRYESITDPYNFEAQPNCHIKIASEKTISPIAIDDSGSGIGMTKKGLFVKTASDKTDSAIAIDLVSDLLFALAHW